MTSFVTAEFRFLHVAKTGGIWASQAMLAAGIVPRPDAELGFHADLEQTAVFDDLFTIAFVRHPLAWWRSYWAHRMQYGWVADHHVDRVAASDRFDEFVRAVIDHRPETAGAIFERYVGPAQRPIEFVGYHEHLVADLERALRYGGARYDAHALRAEKPINVADYDSYPARYTRALACELARAERRAIERFYPWMAVPEELIARRRSQAPAQPTSLALAPSEELVRRARDAVALSHALARMEARVATAEAALGRLRDSRLLRYSRPLRIAYYRLRARLRSLRKPAPTHGRPT